MISVSSHRLQPEQWQREMAGSIQSIEELFRLLKLPHHPSDAAQQACQQFALRVTHYYLGLMQPGNPDDPLLRQVLPLSAELNPIDGFTRDPVGDHAASLESGLLHKYPGRALLMTTGACAIHCRYCFRRHYPYQDENALRHIDSVLATLRQKSDIKEVILSGGDPLSLSDRRLKALLTQLEEIPHLQRLRVHSRLPVVLPSRITPHLIDMFGGTRLATSLVLHCNHPREVTAQLAACLAPLRAAGVTLLNQAVLLKGVNDTLETQIMLSEDLFQTGILPYYLHLLDPVDGAAHFALDPSIASKIEQGLRENLPGYLVPRVVQEIAGESSKTPLHKL